MTLAKRLSLSFAAVAALLTVGSWGCGSAQAMIITGSVTGTWEHGQGANIKVGDTYTANYSYDDFTLTSNDISYPSAYREFRYLALLRSLVVNSGSYSHTFDLSHGLGFNVIQFQDRISDPSSSFDSFKYFSLFGVDRMSSPGTFSADTVKGTYHDGTSFNQQSAELYTTDNQGNYTNHVYGYNAKFTPDPTTAIPTPALLPGLIGLGVGVLRKRKAEAAKQAIEA